MRYPRRRAPGFRIRILMLTTILLLSGCAQISSVMKGTWNSQMPVLQYYKWAGTLTDPDIEQELEKLRKRDNDPAIGQVQRAILLSVVHKKDNNRYESILRSLNKAIESSVKFPGQIRQGYQQFALIWKDLLEQDRQQARKIVEMRNQVRILQEKNDLLREQLEAIKSIEQQINSREESNKNLP